MFGAFAARLLLQTGETQKWLNMVSHRWGANHIVGNDLLRGGGVSVDSRPVF